MKRAALIITAVLLLAAPATAFAYRTHPWPAHAKAQIIHECDHGKHALNRGMCVCMINWAQARYSLPFFENLVENHRALARAASRRAAAYCYRATIDGPR